MKVAEGNKLIAEFMGENVMVTHTAPNCKEYSSSGPVEGVKDWSKTFLQYHSSWGWLMPVVEKISEPEIRNNKVIREPANVTIYYKNCTIEYSDEDNEFEYKLPKGAETKIQAVWEAAVKFIQWYNSLTT